MSGTALGDVSWEGLGEAPSLTLQASPGPGSHPIPAHQRCQIREKQGADILWVGFIPSKLTEPSMCVLILLIVVIIIITPSP